MDGGNLSDALVDFTSGVSEMIDLRLKVEGFKATAAADEKKAFFDMLSRELEDHALMCAAITVRIISKNSEQQILFQEPFLSV